MIDVEWHLHNMDYMKETRDILNIKMKSETYMFCVYLYWNAPYITHLVCEYGMVNNDIFLCRYAFVS